MMRIFQIGFLCIVALVLAAQDKQADKIEKLAPYYPTPQIIVEKMLQLGGLKAGEKMFDLGSGDGRIVIMAAQKFKADATGVEFDDSLFNQSMARIKTIARQKREGQPEPKRAAEPKKKAAAAAKPKRAPAAKKSARAAKPKSK